MSLKKLSAIVITLLCSNLSTAKDIPIGIGIGVASVYEGSDQYMVVPDLVAEYAIETERLGVFAIGTHGLTWKYPITDHVKVGLIGSYMQGRKQEIGIEGHKNKDLQGMGNLKGAVTAGAEVSYSLKDHIIYMNSMTALGGRDYGGVNVDNATRIELGVNSHYTINELWGLDYHLSTRYVNKNYNQAYFGVTESQAAQTNFTAYSPGGGFKDVGALLGVHYKLSKKLFLGAKGGGYYLLGDAVDSSIVKQKYGLIAVTGLLYKF